MFPVIHLFLKVVKVEKIEKVEKVENVNLRDVSLE
jgi:hypothetical protein